MKKKSGKKKITLAMWWKYMGARAELRKRRRATIKMLKKMIPIAVEIDPQLLKECKLMTKHDLERALAMVTTSLQIYEYTYGSDLLLALRHQFPTPSKGKQ